MLALVDTSGPAQNGQRMETTDVTLSVVFMLSHGKFSVDPETLAGLDAGQQIEAVWRKAEAEGVLPSDLSREQLERYYRVVEANSRAASDYQPGPYPGRLVFFRAQRRAPGMPVHPELPWIEFATGGVEVHVVPGTHLSINNPPDVGRVGELLRVAIERELRLLRQVPKDPDRPGSAPRRGRVFCRGARPCARVGEPGAAAAVLPAQTPTANPELVGTLAKEIGATPQQAEGAAGALFGLAKTRLKPEDWSKVAGAVPGMDGLLKAAPAADSGLGSVGALAGAVPGAGDLGGLASVAGAFKKLGLKPEMATKAVPILTDYVGKAGGADVGQILAGALK